MEKFGELISQKRNELKWTQDELAEKLFVTRQTVSRWERGHSYPTIDTLVKLSQLLDFSLDFALLGDGEMVEKVSEEQKKALRNKWLLLMVVIFLILSMVWSVINLFQLNTRVIPPERIESIEVDEKNIIILTDDSGFWSSRSAMIDWQEGEKVSFEVNQYFNFLSIFKDDFQYFVMSNEGAITKDVKSIELKDSKKMIPIEYRE